MKMDDSRRDSGHANITIGDVAEALGVSKTTVSRAISGKGRIGEATRKRVQAYIEEHHYKPNPIAKGLAQSKTYNVCWVMPGDSTVTDLPFFQRCMIGIGEVAAAEDYDILISLVYDNDISQLERIVNNHKADGVILGRTLVEDANVEFLKKSGIPFVVIGSSMAGDVVQIDNDHISACKELTSILVMKGIRKLALVGGDSNHVVNQTRRKGFEQGLLEQGVPHGQARIYMDNETAKEVDRAVEDALPGGAECLGCLDDRICDNVLNKLHRDGVLVPEQVKVASFYNSVILETHRPSITTLQYDPKELGMVACKTLFELIDGAEVKDKVLLGYEVVLKGSTK